MLLLRGVQEAFGSIPIGSSMTSTRARRDFAMPGSLAFPALRGVVRCARAPEPPPLLCCSMARIPDKEFERLAVLHAMGALSEEEATAFREAREERGQKGDRLVQGVERAFAGAKPGAPGGTVPTERADLAAVTGRPIDTSRRWPWVVALVVLGAVAIGAAAWALQLQSQLERTRTEGARAAALADTLQAAVAERDTALASVPNVAELTPLLADPALVVVSLEGEGETTGRLLASPGGRGAILVVTGLPRDGGPYRLVKEGPEGPEVVAELGIAPAGFLFSLFSTAGFVDEARVLRLVAPSPDATAPDAVLLEGRVPAR